VIGAAGTAGLSFADAASARRAAAAILREGRFHAPSVPRPFHAFFHAIGNALSSVGRWIGHAVDQIGRVVPGGPVVVWVLLGLMLIAAIALGARRYARRDLEREHGGPGAAREAGRERAADLEREALRAEHDGRYADAVRLRFRAGLVTLAERGAISPPRSIPTAELRRTLHSEDFDELARRFDQIAYGAAPAAAQDAEEARRRWTTIVTGSRSR
jgi:hypothetical protein